MSTKAANTTKINSNIKVESLERLKRMLDKDKKVEEMLDVAVWICTQPIADDWKGGAICHYDLVFKTR